MNLKTFAIAAFLMLPACFSYGQSFEVGRIDGLLLEDFKQGPADWHSAIIMLRNQVDVEELNASMLRANYSRDERLPVLFSRLQETAKRDQAGLIQFLSTSDMVKEESIKSLWIANMILLDAKKELLEALSLRPEVDGIFKNIPMRPLGDTHSPIRPPVPNGREPGLDVIKAPALWQLGYTGYGTKILVMDSGTDSAHPALRRQFRYQNAPIEATYSTERLEDYCDFHGSQVASAAIGLDRLNNDTLGAAFNGEWLAAGLPLLNRETDRPCTYTGKEVTIFEAFEWALNPDGNINTTDDIPDVINNSWGSSFESIFPGQCSSSPYNNTFENIRVAGIGLIFSAGNSGTEAPESTISFPATLSIDEVTPLAVGSISNNFSVANFSSRGPSGCGGAGSLGIKPEVMAPGVNVRSASPGANYQTVNGTSFSAPYVAGAFLLLKEAFPELDGGLISQALYQSATDLGAPGEDNTYGNGVIDVLAAFNYLVDQGNTPTPPVSSPNDAILADLRGNTLHCDRQLFLSAVIENAGTDDINSLDLVVRRTINQQELARFQVDGNLPPGATAEVDMPNIPANAGIYEISVTIENPNGQPDLRVLNNRMKMIVEVRNNSLSPTITTFGNENSCVGSQVLLQASYSSSNGFVRWYDRLLDGNALSEGDALIIDAPTSDRTLYAELNFKRNLGLENLLGSDQVQDNSLGGLVFDCDAPLTLNSVKVFAQGAGPRGIILRGPNGSVQQKVVNLVDGEQRIDLGFEVSPGDDYELALSFGNALTSNALGAQFPYQIFNVISITGSNNNDASIYSYFYDWELEYSNFCGRNPVIVSAAGAGASPVADFEPADSIFFLNEQGEATASFQDRSEGANAWMWDFGDGGISTEQNPTYTYTAQGIYDVVLVAVSPSGCSSARADRIEVQLPTSAMDFPEFAANISLFPNPASQEVQVQFDFEKDRQVAFFLTDVYGRQVRQYNMGNITRQQQSLSVLDLPDGVYFLVFLIDGQRFGRRLVVARP